MTIVSEYYLILKIHNYTNIILKSFLLSKEAELYDFFLETDKTLPFQVSQSNHISREETREEIEHYLRKCFNFDDNECERYYTNENHHFYITKVKLWNKSNA